MTQQVLVDGIRMAVRALEGDRLTPGQIDEVRRALRKTLVDAGIDAAPRFITAAEQSTDGREYVLFKVWSYETREDCQEFILPYTDELKAYLDSSTRRKPRATLVNQIVEFNQSVDEFYRERTPQRVDASQVEYILDMNNVGERFNGKPAEYLRNTKIAALALLGANAGDIYGPFDSRSAVGRILGRDGRVGIAETFEFNVDEYNIPEYFGYTRWFESILADRYDDDDDY